MAMRSTVGAVPNGLCAVYKPAGPTSFDVVARIRALLRKSTPEHSGPHPSKKLKPVKVGHGGTLDPFASGVLVLGLGDGCRLLQEYLTGSKEYLATGLLGTETDTLDTEGKEVLRRPFDHVTRDLIDKELARFVGDIWQKPPAYSALRVNGQRAYDLARAGEEVDLPARQVRVHALQLVDFKPPYFTVRIECGGGFYVRKLVQDLAHRLDTCAHTVALERTKHGPFTLDTALKEEEWTPEAIHRSVASWRSSALRS